MSFDRIDHAAEAEGLIEFVGKASMTSGKASVSMTAAAVHAVLALVEQQRIANLIALATLTDVDTDGDKLRADAMDRLVRWVPHGPDDEHPEMRPEIAAALGIEKEENDD